MTWEESKRKESPFHEYRCWSEDWAKEDAWMLKNSYNAQHAAEEFAEQYWNGCDSEGIEKIKVFVEDKDGNVKIFHAIPEYSLSVYVEEVES